MRNKFFTMFFLIFSCFMFSQTTRKFKGTYHKKEIELLVYIEKNVEKRHIGEMKFVEKGEMYKIFFTQVTPQKISIEVFDKELEFCNGDLFSNGGATYKGTLLSVFDEKRKMTIKEIKE